MIGPYPSEWYEEDAETQEPRTLLIQVIAGLSLVLAGLAMWIRFGGQG